MYNRNFYTNRIQKWQDKPVIKILTGLRRSGKSTLIKLYMESLLKAGIPQSRILYINKEQLKFEYIRTYKELYKEVATFRKKAGQKIYLFVDEVQEIEQWEKAIISVHSEKMADIYLTGSNAKIFSSELATLLGGRYVQFPIFPLTYSEFLTFLQSPKHEDTYFNDYLKFGGLPGIHHLEWEEPVIFEYLNSIFDTIILRDIVKRNNIRNAAFLEKIIQFVLDNVAQIFSAKRVVDFLKQEHRKTNIETVYNYIRFLEDAHFIYRVPRFDIKGKRLLEVREKYFVADWGLRHSRLGFKQQDINQLLENIVFIELKKRGFSVNIGQLNGAEIDFIAQKNGQRAYIQVAYLLASQETIEREFGVLAKIKDNYPKYVLSLDRFFASEIEGIKHVNLIDFLLNEDFSF